jgi:hypothetical protein
MMRIKQFSVLAGLGLALAGCGGDDETLKNYAKAKRFSENQTAAFLACAAATRSNKPILPGPLPKTQVKMVKVPYDVCVCQSSAIMSVFVPKKYPSYSTFAEYLAKEKKKKAPRFSKKALQGGVKPGDASPRLEKSFVSCVAGWTKQNVEEAKTVFEPVVPKEPEADPKKTANAS